MNISVTGLTVVIVVVALCFDYTNGFHDSANAIATSVSTRALTPRVALIMAALANVVGALISTKVAATIGSGIIARPSGRDGLDRACRAWRRDRLEPSPRRTSACRPRRRTH